MFILRLKDFDSHIRVPPAAVQHDAKAALPKDLTLLDLLVVDLKLLFITSMRMYDGDLNTGPNSPNSETSEF